jgi:hypothetical protein
VAVPAEGEEAEKETPAGESEETGGEQVVAPEEPAAPAEVGAEAAEDTAEAPKLPEGLHVTLEDGLLSVNAKDQTFGAVIAAIANAAGFDVALSNDVFEAKLSTRFTNTDLERGILRLLSLIDQRNYSIDYGPEGEIKTLEVFGDLSRGQRTLSGSRSGGKAPPTLPAYLIKEQERLRQLESGGEAGEAGGIEVIPEEGIVEEDMSIRTKEGAASGQPGETTEESAPVDPMTTDNDGDGYSEIQGDCNDATAAISPGAFDICGDGIDQDCSGSDAICPIDPFNIDDDGDGYTENQGDCNDATASIRPGAPDICGDGIDQDCSGADAVCPVDPLTTDDDGDGYSENQGDCNDATALIFPGAVDICGDGIDQDCSGADATCPPLDTDNDGDGYTENQGDCDDTSALISPGAVDICGDGIDQDCSGADAVCQDPMLEIIPEGPIPPDDQLLDAPHI